MTVSPATPPAPEAAPAATLGKMVENAIDTTAIEKAASAAVNDPELLLHHLIAYGPSLAAFFSVFFILVNLKKIMIAWLTRRAQGDAPETQRTGWHYWALPFVRRISTLFILMVSLLVGARLMPLSDSLWALINLVFGLVIILQIGLSCSTVLNLWGQRVTRGGIDRKYDQTQATMVATLTMIAQIALWVLIALIALDNVGVNVTTLVAGLGIGGVAIAFAFKSIMEDVFASLSIAFDKPFMIGDFIISGDHMGTVEKIGMKNIRIRSLSGEQIVINNNDILQSRIRNYGRMYERRVLFTLGVEYGTPADTLEKIPAMIRDIITAQPQTRFDRSHFKDYGAYALNFETVYYLLTPDYNTMMDIQQAINMAIYRAFAAEGIAFAFPTQTIQVKDGGLPPAAVA